VSEDVEQHIGNIECLAENLKKIKEIFEKEPSPEHLRELGDAVRQALKDMSPINRYFGNLRDEVRIYHSQDKAKELGLLFRPIEGSHLLLDFLRMDIDIFSMTLENMRRKGIAQNTSQTTRLMVEFGKFWERHKRIMGDKEAEIRRLIKVLMLPPAERMKMLPIAPYHVAAARQLVTNQLTTEDWKKPVREVFPSCPFCNEKMIYVDIRFGRPFDYVACTNCIAKWQIEWKDNVEYKIDSIMLTRDSVDRKGQDFLGRLLRPAFWKDLSTNPMKAITAADALDDERMLSGEKRERIRANARNALKISLIFVSFGLLLLGLRSIGTWGDAVTMVMSLLVVGFFVGLGLLVGVIGIINWAETLRFKSPRDRFKKIIKITGKTEKAQKQDDGSEQLLVECGKCHTRYERFLFTKCPNCGTENV
jgi:ssDNA-binding Zn-finger/Zn-ribbon topoisomerase 1